MVQDFTNNYDFSEQTIIITGGAGVLGSEMARALLACGANVAILNHNLSSAQKKVDSLLSKAGHGQAIAIEADVTDVNSVRSAVENVLTRFGQVDGLINAAGGNKPQATSGPDQSFFDIPIEAMQWVLDLNLLGTIIPSQVVAKHMAGRQRGVILNVASMNAFRPLTRIPVYSASKAGVSNFTQWLAVHLAQEYSPNIRVNAVAPGFYLTEQNRFLMTDSQTGVLTARGQKIIDHTPAGRFGKPEDLDGVVLWLLSPASAFVTGVIIPVDGGFSAYSGV